MRGILLIVFMLVTSLVFGTHNRAGEISYKHKGNLTYEITVTTYTDPASTSADRCTLDVDLGDGAIETIFRNNGTKNLCPQLKPRAFCRAATAGNHTHRGRP